MVKHTLLSAAVVLALSACGGNDAPQVPANKLPADHTKENLLEFNKQYMQLEEEEIAKYVDSLHLQVQKHKSGIYYQMLSSCVGKKPVPGDVVDITYTVTLLSGEGCADLKQRNTKVEMGKGKLPKGIEWGVEQLSMGGTAFYIIPAMLAYGVSGRENCVPPYSPVRCIITLNKIEKAK